MLPQRPGRYRFLFCSAFGAHADVFWMHRGHHDIEPLIRLCTKSENPTHGSEWIVQIFSTRNAHAESGNPTNGSWWMVQILSIFQERR